MNYTRTGYGVEQQKSADCSAFRANFFEQLWVGNDSKILLDNQKWKDLRKRYTNLPVNVHFLMKDRSVRQDLKLVIRACHTFRSKFAVS